MHRKVNSDFSNMRIIKWICIHAFNALQFWKERYEVLKIFRIFRNTLNVLTNVQNHKFLITISNITFLGTTNISCNLSETQVCNSGLAIVVEYCSSETQRTP